MYTQIMKEILLELEFEQKHIIEFIEYCRVVLAENENELKNLKKLERNYRNETPIWWYTYDCFLYPMLSRALRLMNADIIIQMGFFIGDLRRHVEQLHKEQFNGQNSGKSFTVYRRQGMSKLEGENRTVSLNFANNAVNNPDLVGILFVMAIDPAKSTTPLTSIADISYFKAEDELLFSMHTVFRISEITSMDENHRLFRVELTLISDNNKDLRRLTDHIREETFPDSKGWFRLDQVLFKMGQFDKAQNVYEVLLEQGTEEREKGPIFSQIGSVKDEQSEYKEAVKFYKKSLVSLKKALRPNHPDLTMCYSHSGNVYSTMNEHSKALSFCQFAVDIGQRTLSSSHVHFQWYRNRLDDVKKKL